jgi:hypothetical protein
MYEQGTYHLVCQTLKVVNKLFNQLFTDCACPYKSVDDPHEHVMTSFPFTVSWKNKIACL